tara:strand:+ start:247 stop:2646 length:2400 start_codon:yes stop_codon:yes gene_type:complete
MDRIDEILFLYEDDVVEMADGGRILLGDGGFVQKQIDEINRLIRDTDLNQSDIAEAVNKKFPKEKPLKNYNVTHYAKKYFGVKTPKYKPGVSVAGVLTPAYKKRFTFKERKGKLLTDILEKEDLVESIKTDVANKLTKEQIVDKYRIGGKGEKLLPSGVKQIGKGTLEEIYEKLDIVRGRADLRKVDINTPENKKNLKNIKKFFSDAKLSRAEAYDKTGLSRGQVDKLLARYKQQKGEPLIVNRKTLGVQFEGAGQERNVFKQKTKELQRFQTFLKKYKNKPLRSGTVELAKAIKKFGTNPVGFQQNLSMLRRIYKGQERPGFKIDNELKSIIGKFPISTALTGDVLIEAGYTPKQIDKLNKAQAIIRKLDANQGSFLNQLEHKVPKAVASELLNKGQISKSQYRDIIGKITPVTTDLNQWKKQYDLQRLMNVKNYLASNMEADDLKKFNKIENDIIKTAKKISGGYDIGKINIDANNKITLQSPDEVFTAKSKGIGTGSRSLIDYYKNIKYHNILAKKYNANKGDAAFGTLRSYRAGADVPIFDEKITNEISKLSSSEDFTKYLTKNTDGPLFKGLTKLVSPQMRRKLLSAGKIGGAATLATLIPSMLLARTPDGTEARSILPEVAGGAAAGSLAFKPVRQAVGKGLKATGRLLSKFAVPIGIGAEAYFAKQAYDEGKSIPEIMAAPFLLEGKVRKAQDLLSMSPEERQAVNRASREDDISGLSSDFDTPRLEGVDEVDIEEVLKRVQKKRMADEARRREERKAGGGIAGIRKPDAIPPESGPNPQGLENLKYYVTNT